MKTPKLDSFQTPKPEKVSMPAVAKPISRPAKINSEADKKKKNISVSFQEKDKPTERPTDRATVREQKRIKTRYAFEFFQDQVAKLKELRRNALIKDEDFSMSDIVRKALDEYLNKPVK